MAVVMGAGGGAKAKTTPIKQSAKTTSITSMLTSAINGIKTAVKTVASAVSKAISTAAEAAKKKAAAEAAAKKKQTTTKPTTAKTTTASSTPSANKNDLISWGDNRFFVTANHVRSYKSLQITTSCATEDEENGGDKYVKKKNNGGYEVKFTAILDKRLGESDVRKVALHLAEVARTGAKNYIYCSGSKLFTPQMMGTGASIKNIVIAPDGTWISCEVDLTLKQCSKGDGSTSPSSGGGGGGGGGYKYSVTVYYSGSSGAISSVTGYSNISKEDARKKAWAKVPGNAQWASETKKQATNQTTNAKNAANTTTDNAKKDATKYVNDKVNTVKNGGGSSKVTTTKTATKAVRMVA